MVEPCNKQALQKGDLLAETGHLEMSAEFVRHVKHSFILKGPKEQTEGGNRNVTPIVPERGPPMVDEGVPNNKVLIVIIGTFCSVDLALFC